MAYDFLFSHSLANSSTSLPPLQWVPLTLRTLEEILNFTTQFLVIEDTYDYIPWGHYG